MKLELHVIQSFGPSCLNRDDTNSPKDCIFGDVRRARVSSQCFKRAMRGYFRDHNLVPVGERTKRLRQEIIPRLQVLEPAELVPYAVDAFVDTYYSKPDSKKPEHAAVLLFLSSAEMDTIASIIRDGWDDLQKVAAERRKKEDEIRAKNVKKARAVETTEGEAEAEGSAGGGKFENLPRAGGGKPDKKIVELLKEAALSSDIALFGRMLAEHTEHKIEGACQVAHAISTHQVAPEMDFFSAVDDLNTDDSGAGMLGLTGFNAACFYRYALLDFDALVNNLGGDTETAVQTARAFAQAFVHALPSGKQNSMAAQSLPSLGFFVVRDSGSPCSLVNAFCTPVQVTKTDRESEIGLLDKSVGKLATYWTRYTGAYGDKGISEKTLFCTEDPEQVKVLGTPVSIDEAIETAIAALTSYASA